MTGDPYQPVIPGTTRQAPSARTFNGLLKSGQDYSRRRFGDLETGAGGAAVDPQTECLVQNKTGVDLPAFSVLVQGAAIIDPATLPFDVQAQKVFEAAAVVDAAFPFVITEGPVAADGFIEAVASGLAPVNVNITDATHTRAVPVAGVTDHLVSAASGGVVLWWTPGGTGTKTCLVLMGSGSGAGPTIFGSSQDGMFVSGVAARTITIPVGTFIIFAQGLVSLLNDGTGFYGIVAAASVPPTGGSLAGVKGVTGSGGVAGIDSPLSTMGVVTNNGSTPNVYVVWNFNIPDVNSVRVDSLYAMPVTLTP